MGSQGSVSGSENAGSWGAAEYTGGSTVSQSGSGGESANLFSSSMLAQTGMSQTAQKAYSLYQSYGDWDRAISAAISLYGGSATDIASELSGAGIDLTGSTYATTTTPTTEETTDEEDASGIDYETVLTSLLGQSQIEPSSYTQTAFSELQNTLSESKSFLSELQSIRDMADLTGGLTDEEESYISQIEQNSISLLETEVDEWLDENLDSLIAEYSSRGLLSPGGTEYSSITEGALAKTTTEAAEAIASGTTEIASTGLQGRLDIMSQNKDIAKELILGSLSTSADVLGTMGSTASTMGSLGTTVTQQQSEWQQALLNAVTGLYATDTAVDIANIEAEATVAAAEAAGEGAMVGGAASGLGDIIEDFIPFFSSIRFKENVIDTGIRLNGVPVVTFQYKHDKSKHIGFIAEDLAESYPQAVIFDSKGIPLAINYKKLKEVWRN